MLIVDGLEKQLYEEAVDDIEKAKRAIIGYAITHGHLPCSDIWKLPTTDLSGNPVPAVEDNGDERREPDQTCVVLEDDEYRVLPFNELGVPALDPWGSPYRYYADGDYSRDDDPGTVAVDELFVLNNQNGIQIDDGSGTDIADNVAFVVYSLGIDRGRNNTSQQSENRESGASADDDRFSSSTFIPINGSDGFDDIISWVSTHELKLYMLEAEILPRN